LVAPEDRVEVWVLAQVDLVAPVAPLAPVAPVAPVAPLEVEALVGQVAQIAQMVRGVVRHGPIRIEIGY
jgi:hypothetical protein